MMKRASTLLGVTMILGACAHVPRDMVGYFNTDVCPKGWANVGENWNGRYVVMGREGRGQTVGEALRPGENRVTGDHGHSVGIATTPPRGSADNNSALWGDNGFIPRPLEAGSATPRNSGETVRPGTNAPYVTLKACTKL